MTASGRNHVSEPLEKKGKLACCRSMAHERARAGRSSSVVVVGRRRSLAAVVGRLRLSLPVFVSLHRRSSLVIGSRWSSPVARRPRSPAVVGRRRSSVLVRRSSAIVVIGRPLRSLNFSIVFRQIRALPSSFSSQRSSNFAFLSFWHRFQLSLILG